jgi:hypothetical protein
MEQRKAEARERAEMEEAIAAEARRAQAVKRESRRRKQAAGTSLLRLRRLLPATLRSEHGQRFRRCRLLARLSAALCTG